VSAYYTTQTAVNAYLGISKPVAWIFVFGQKQRGQFLGQQEENYSKGVASSILTAIP
jgi:hypothetical protein